MTWIEAAVVACAVYAALVLTLVAIRQQLRSRGEWERLGYHLRGDVEFDLDCPMPDVAVPAADPEKPRPMLCPASLATHQRCVQEFQDFATEQNTEDPAHKP